MRSKRCTSKFATASELEGHLLEKHRKFQPIKVYETCDQCGIELKNAKDKERHIRKHLTEEFDCSQLWRCRADSDCERVCESAKSSFKNTILLINKIIVKLKNTLNKEQKQWFISAVEYF